MPSKDDAKRARKPAPAAETEALDREIARWLPDTQKIESATNPLNLPLATALDEATACAAFVLRYWEPGTARPGLKRVRARTPRTISEEILSLVRAVQAAQTRATLAIGPAGPDPERIATVLDTLTAALEFTLDDGVEEPADAQLATLKSTHADLGSGAAETAQALRDFAELARELAPRITAADEDFDVALIDEARKLAAQLVDADDSDVEESRAALVLRNRLLGLLQQRVRGVRSAARYVFREYPEIVREVTSTYDRRRRTAARRAAKGGDTGGDAAKGGTGNAPKNPPGA